MRANEWLFRIEDRRGTNWQYTWVEVWKPESPQSGMFHHRHEQMSLAVAAFRALGVEFELVDGWDKK
jgi:hypothetical protein